MQRTKSQPDPPPGAFRIERRPMLVVDDDRDVREALTEAFRYEGREVMAVSNGQEAIDWLHRRPTQPHVVLLDLMMPVLDGRGFIEARKHDSVLMRSDVIILTAGGDCREVSRSLGVKHCLLKTTPLQQLLVTVESSEKTS